MVLIRSGRIDSTLRGREMVSLCGGGDHDCSREWCLVLLLGDGAGS